MTKKSFESVDNLFKFWESFKPEVLNQKVSRLLLSVHKKCRRLTVLGELGRYPVLVPAFKLCLKYQYEIEKSNKSTLIFKALSDMKKSQMDNWYTKVEKMKLLLKIPKLYGKPNKVGSIIEKNIKSKFERFFLDEINLVRRGSDGLDHNKLRFFKTLKAHSKQNHI